MISFYKTVSQFVSFIFEWRKAGGQLVDQNTANTRAAICVGCHNNKPTNEIRKKACCGGGAAQNAAVVVARATVIRGKSTPYDKNLLACNLCGCDLKIKVWIPSDVLLKTEDANAYPSFCWAKAITDGKNV